MSFGDILVYSNTWNDHLQHLQQVFEPLLQHQFYLKLFKCSLRASQIEYLGHIINSYGVAMDNKKIASMLEWPVPQNVNH